MSNSNRIEKPWYKFKNPKQDWLVSSIFGFLIYLFVVFVFNWSFTNYFLLSLQIGIQLYFLLSNLKESLTINQGELVYRFLFIKRVYRPEYFVVHRSVSLEDFSKKNVSLFGYKRFQRLTFYKNDKIVFSLDDINWPDEFEQLIELSKENFEEYEISGVVKAQYISGEFPSSIFLFGLVLLIFAFGLQVENAENKTIEEFHTIQGHIDKQPWVSNDIRKGAIPNRILIFKLKEFSDFHFYYEIPKRGRNVYTYKELKGVNNYIETNRINDYMEFVVSKEEFDYLLNKNKKYKYFSSHLQSMNYFRVYRVSNQETQLFGNEKIVKSFPNKVYDFSYIFILMGVIHLGVAFSYISFERYWPRFYPYKED